jgi:hypothetical protein
MRLEEMSVTFLLDYDLRPVSCVVPDGTEGALTVGLNVALVCDFATEYGNIPAGTKGFVDYVHPDGLVELLMAGTAPALLHWGNRLYLVPFETDELADSLVCALRQIYPRPNVTHLKTG